MTKFTEKHINLLLENPYFFKTGYFNKEHTVQLIQKSNGNVLFLDTFQVIVLKVGIVDIQAAI